VSEIGSVLLRGSLPTPALHLTGFRPAGERLYRYADTLGPMISLTQPALKVLSEVGWTERYRWNPPGWQNAVQAEGFQVSAAAVAFVNRFGGLTLRGSRIAFDPVAAVRNEEPSDESRLLADRGIRISIVGTDHGYLNVWVADDGRVVLSVDADSRIVGDDMFDGMNALCEGDDYQVTRARRHLARGGGAA
jgi:hypothetical protein